MTAFYTEADYENSIIELFQGMGYQHIYGPDIERVKRIFKPTKPKWSKVDIADCP